MFEPRALQRAAIWRVDGLAPLLLVSLLIHLSLICFPCPGRSGGGRLAEGAAVPSLQASLSCTVRAVAPEPRRQERASAPVLEPARSVPEPSADDELGSNRQTGPAFYAAEALTIRPVALSEPVLDAGGTGEVVLALWIDEQGAVVDLSVERSELPADRIAAVADAFRLVRFAPGELNGQKVGAVMRIEVSYDDERLPVEP